MPTKGDGVQPVPDPWRPIFCGIVHAFVTGDYALAVGIEGVNPVSEDDARRMAASVEDYGATLVDLTDEVWETSIVQWTGAGWEVLVDLRTAEEGRSDLSLVAGVREVDGVYEVEVEGVWVE